MEFEVFKNTIRGFVNAEMPGTSMYEKRICKAGEDYLGLVVEIGRINPVLNLDELFESYQNGKQISDICEDVIASLKVELIGGTDFADDYERAKSRLFIRVVGVKENAEYLHDKVHKYELGTIAIVPCVMVSETKNGMATAPVTKSIAKFWGVPDDQIIADAIENAPNVIPCEMKSLNEKIAEIMPGFESDMPCDTYFAGADQFGAACIFYPGFLEAAADEMECDFFVLPSSIHEVLFEKDNGRADEDFYFNTVKSINATEVSPADKLCDALFYYDNFAGHLIRIR